MTEYAKLDPVFLRKIFAGNPLYLFDVIDSTNQFLVTQAAQLAHGTICLAEQQTAGRGRRGNVWHSPAAGNIYLSQLFCFQGELTKLTGLSLVIGLTIADCLSKQQIKGIKVKWPNDLHWHNQKFGGILVETVPLGLHKFAVVVGVGLNLAMQPSQQTEQISQAWTSLNRIANRALDKNQLVVALVNAIEAAVAVYFQQGLAPFMQDWTRFDSYVNQQVTLIGAQQQQQGVAKGIDQTGALLVDIDGVLHRFQSGEVSLRLG